MRLKPLCLILPLLFFSPATPGELQQQELLRSPSGLKLELKTDKKQYKLGEPVFVTLTLTNDGQKAFYLSPEFIMYGHAFGDWPMNLLEIEVQDPQGQLLKPTGMPIAEYGWQEEKTPVYQFILRTRIYFSPGDFRGFTRSLKELGFELEKPGRYRLRATYWEPSYKNLVTEEEFEEAKKILRYPWWAKLESDWVWIEILPK
ncbi:hypothetical protein MYX77_03260 [Acidobacteriia bacterium AH_259_A11_L15]|nr:hypothetical protein [Acidobacteriia bacterium AH_259_A11_L15]